MYNPLPPLYEIDKRLMLALAPHAERLEHQGRLDHILRLVEPGTRAAKRIELWRLRLTRRRLARGGAMSHQDRLWCETFIHWLEQDLAFVDSLMPQEWHEPIDDRPTAAPELCDDAQVWRTRAGLAGGAPPRPKSSEPRGRLLETPAAGLKALGQSGKRKDPDYRKLSRTDASPACGSQDLRAWRSVGDVADAVLVVLRRQRMCAQTHALGDRVFFELLDELDRHGIAPWALTEARLERFASLDPEVLTALGGDRMPPLPIHAVPDPEDQEGDF
jgi:hypothetical protein